MQIQINTDESVDGREALSSHAQDVVKDVLGRFADHVTRIEIHMSDVNGQKAGDHDKRVVMEARIAGRQPIAVTDQAGSLHQAIDGAAQKMRRSLDTTFGKMADKRRAPAPPLPADPALPDDDPV
ncbi:MAG: ribosomal subunit interface protein [Lysobacteraceae bacterium]|nr:MAG: ribosomal subunit interface protein [Xanthomonadaceae bacterium]